MNRLGLNLVAIALSFIAACAQPPNRVEELAHKTFHASDLDGRASVLRFPVETGQYYLVRVTQHALDVAVSLALPGVEELGPNTLLLMDRGAEYAMLQALQPGIGTLDIRAVGPARNGYVEVSVLRLPFANKNDRRRIDAYTALSEATRQTASRALSLWQPRIEAVGQACGNFKRLRLDQDRRLCDLIYAQLIYFYRGDWAAASNIATRLSTDFADANMPAEHLAARRLAAMADIERRIDEAPEILALRRRHAAESLQQIAQQQLQHGWVIDAAWTINNLGVAYFYQGNYSEAGEQFSRAVELATEQGVALYALTAGRNLALSQRKLGHLRQANQSLQEVVHSFEDTPGIPNVELGHTLDELGSIQLALGRWRTAIGTLDRAMAMLKQAPESDRARVLSRLASAYLSVQDIARAEYYIQRALDLEDAVIEVETRRMIDYVQTEILVMSGQFEQAEARFASLAVSAANAVERAQFLLRRAENSRSNGAIDHAIYCIQLALQALPLNSPLYPRVLIAYAKMSSASEGPDWPAIDKSMRQAREMLDKNYQFETEIEFMYVDALLASAKGDPVRALALSTQAVELLWQQRTFLTVPGYLDRSSEILDQHVRLLIRSAQAYDPAAQEALALIVGLQTSWNLAAGPVSDVVRSEQERLRELQYMISLRRPEDGRVAREALISQREDVLRKLDSIDRAPTWSGQRLDALGREVLASMALSEDMAVMVYWVDSPESFLWILQHDDIRLLRLPDRVALEKQVANVFRYLNRQGFERSLRPAMSQLADMVITPALNQVSASNLAIVPHGVLQAIPFAALPVDDSGTMLVDRFDLTTMHPSPRKDGRLIARQADYKANIFANPVIEADALFVIDPLPGSQREAERIADLFEPSSVRVFTGIAATRDNLLTSLDRSEAILHVATHAIADPRSRSSSAIILSAQSTDQGIDPASALITPHDIASMSIRSPLVVLSACDTAVGKLYRYDGVLGLHRAFIDAGSGSVVASLWRVNDRAASLVMEAFYAALIGDDLQPYQALSRVMRRRREILPRYLQDTYFWAPWISMSTSLPPVITDTLDFSVSAGQ